MTKRRSKILSLSSIFAAWPSLAAAARAIGAPYETAKAWRRRGRAPVVWHKPIIRAAAKRGVVVTLEQLAAHHEAGVRR